VTNDLSENWFDPKATTFGDRLSGAREQVGMTQEQLAERLGVRLSTLRKWEEDRSEPRVNRLMMLSGLLSVSFGWLLSGDGPGLNAPRDAAAEDGRLDDAIEELRELNRTALEMADRIKVLGTNLRNMRGKLFE
jgi:transcriptional regulator with XRE-family HTH domain